MDDMNAFERQVVGQIHRFVGPSRPVDDAAIFTAITTTQSPKWRFQAMFSATKFVVAGAIVALFGGFLLAGVLTQPRGDEVAPGAVSPSPTTTADLLAGLVTDEVEPGVLRVRDDGAGFEGSGVKGLAISREGRVWLFKGGSMFELGQVASEVSSNGVEPGFWSDMAFTADGVFWAKLDAGQDEGTLASFDGEGWTEHPLPDGAPIGAIEATPDGAVLVTGHVADGPGPLVAHLDDDGWTMLPTLDDPGLAGNYYGGAAYLAAAPDGTVWLSNGRLHGGPTNSTSPQGLLRYDGDRWQVVEPMPDAPSMRAGPVAVGPDGTLWVYMLGKRGQDRYLARWADDTWSLFSKADGVPQLVWPQDWESRFEVDGDGTLWMPYRGTSDRPSDVSADRCPGVISFDGSAWRQYLEGRCRQRNTDLAVAPDGSVWVTSTGLLYVITPEAVGATG